MAKILIVGCGDLGIGLANLLVQDGHEVIGLRRNPPATDSMSIRYFRADIANASELAELPGDFEHVLFIVSPSGRNADSYRAVYETGINNLLEHFSQHDRNPPWLFVSSTSVYGQYRGEWVDEDSPVEPASPTSRYIRQAELRLIAANPANIVVRFSGIYGPGRESLLRMVTQSPEIQRDPPYYTNRIHRDDCIGVLAFLIQQRLIGRQLQQCFLASDDDPAPMWDVVSWLAGQQYSAPPRQKAVGDNSEQNKRCSNRRLKALGYRFQYPTYKDGYAALLEARRQSG